MNAFKNKLNLKYIKDSISKIDDDILIKTEPNFHRQLTEITLEEKRNAESRKRIIFNARGNRFDVLTRVLGNFPDTRLGKIITILNDQSKGKQESSDDLLDLCDDFDLSQNEFYFDRDEIILKSVLTYFKTGHLHFPTQTCVRLFDDELAYWGLDACLVDDCCQANYTAKKDDFEDEIKVKKKVLNQLYFKEDFGHILPVWREKIWNVLHRPFESNWGKVIFIQYIKFHLIR
jgi:hypothetical protein